MTWAALAVIISVVFGVLSGRTAEGKGHNPVLWFWLGMVFSVIALVLITRKPAFTTHEEIAAEVAEWSGPGPIHFNLGKS